MSNVRGQPNTVPCRPQMHQWMAGPTPNSNDVCRMCGWKRSQEASQRARTLVQLEAECAANFHVFPDDLSEDEDEPTFCVRCGREWYLDENSKWEISPHGGPLPSSDEMLTNLLNIREKLK